MATISNTQSIPNPGFKPWTSKVELDTSTGNQIAFVYGGSGTLLYTGTPQEVVTQIPNNTTYAANRAFFDGLISTINEQSTNLTGQYNQLVPDAKTPAEAPFRKLGPLAMKKLTVFIAKRKATAPANPP
jgi:hypothetical protein